MVATLTALNTLRRNYTAVLSRLGFRRTRPTSTAVAIPTGQCSACGEIETGGGMGLPARIPAVAFTFMGADGLTEIAKAILVLDVPRMREVGRLLSQTVNGAIRAAGA